MNSYIIPIVGQIGNPEEGETGQFFTYSDLLMHLNKAKDADVLDLHINSIGGYVEDADKMIQALIATNKQIITRNTGDVASAASKIFTIPKSKENRIFDSSKGAFLIHNPWGTVEGDAAELAAASKHIQSIENEYAKWYADVTGVDISIIKGLMSENIPLTSEQINEFGFATIVASQIKAVAKLKIEKMEYKELEKKMSSIETFFDKILAKFKPKALMLADVNGVELNFPDANAPEEILPGLSVTISDGSTDGKYVMPDGSTYVIVAGKLTEIIAAQADEMANLKAENENLKAEIEKLKTDNASAKANEEEMNKQVLAVKAEFVAFKKEFSSFKPKGSNPPKQGDDQIDTVVRKPFKIKE